MYRICGFPAKPKNEPQSLSPQTISPNSNPYVAAVKATLQTQALLINPFLILKEASI